MRDRCVGQRGGDRLVAADTRDLLDQVLLLTEVAAVRWGRHRDRFPLCPAPRAERAQAAGDLAARERRAEDRDRAPGPERDGRRREGSETRRRFDDPRRHPPPRQAHDQCRDGVERLGRHDRVDPSLEAIRRLRGEPEAAAGSSHRCRGEHGALQEKDAGVGRDLRMRPAHHAGDRHRPARVGDYEVGRLERPLDPVERDDPLPRCRPPHDDLPPGQTLAVEGMQRLSTLEHDVVGGVDHRADQPHPGAAEPEPEPERRSYRPDPPHQPGIVPRAEIRRVDPHAELARRRCAGLAQPRAPPTQPAPGERRHLTRDPQHRKAVAAVGRDLELEHDIRDAGEIDERRAGSGVLGQQADAAFVVAQGELRLGAEGARGAYPAHLDRLHLVAPGQARARERDRHQLSRREPGRPRDHDRRFRGRDVNPADLEAIGPRVRLDGEQAPDADARIEAADLGDVLHREARHGETVGQLGSRTAPRDEIPEPGQRNTHGRRLRRILAEEAEVVLEEEPQVVQIVAEEGETIDAHDERKAAHHLRIIADGAQHVRMDHPRPQDLEPALAATHATARGRSAGHGARRARDVDLRTRLGERKEAGAEADAGLGAEEPAEEMHQNPLQVGEGHLLVNHEAFHLMEHRGMRGVGFVPSIACARHDHPERGSLRAHDADLDRRGVRPQESVVGQGEEQGVLRVPGGMIGGKVEGTEVVEVVFDLGPLGDAEPHGDEDPDDLLLDRPERMGVPARPGATGQRDVGALLGKRAPEPVGCELARLLRDPREDLVLDIVGQGSDRRASGRSPAPKPPAVA